MLFGSQNVVLCINLIFIIVSIVGCSAHLGFRFRKNQREFGCSPTIDDFAKYGLKSTYSNSTDPFSVIKPFTEFPKTNFDRPISTERECKIQPTLLQEDPLWERALCPWAWKVNYNHMRIPAALPEAICKCDKTVTWISKRQRIVFECESVYFSVLVFRFKNDCDQYEEVYEDISMGCVALKQNISPMNRGHWHNDTEIDI